MMPRYPFEFQSQTKFIFGVNTLNQLGDEVEAAGGKIIHVLLQLGVDVFGGMRSQHAKDRAQSHWLLSAA